MEDTCHYIRTAVNLRYLGYVSFVFVLKTRLPLESRGNTLEYGNIDFGVGKPVTTPLHSLSVQLGNVIYSRELPC